MADYGLSESTIDVPYMYERNLQGAEFDLNESNEDAAPRTDL